MSSDGTRIYQSKTLSSIEKYPFIIPMSDESYPKHSAMLGHLGACENAEIVFGATGEGEQGGASKRPGKSKIPAPEKQPNGHAHLT